MSADSPDRFVATVTKPKRKGTALIDLRYGIGDRCRVVLDGRGLALPFP